MATGGLVTSSMANTDSTRTETVPALVGPVQNNTDAFNKDIGFDTLSIAIDNFTGYWLYVEGAANPYIPPFFVGVIRNVLHANTHPKITWASPFGSSQSPVQIGSFFNATFTNYILPYAPGSLAGLPTNPPGTPGPPPIYVTFDPNIIVNVSLSPTTINAIINGICDCIGGGGSVTPHGAKVVIYNPVVDQVLDASAGFTIIPMPVAFYDTDGYSDGVGLTIPPGQGGLYNAGLSLLTNAPDNTDMTIQLVQTPPTVEPIGTPLFGDEQLVGNLPEDVPRRGPMMFGPLYLPAGTSLYVRAWGGPVSVTLGGGGLWIEKLPDRTLTIPVYTALSFPGVASSDGLGNTVGTFATGAPTALTALYVDWQEDGGTGGLPSFNGMNLISASLGVGFSDVGAPLATAPALHFWTQPDVVIPAAPDWEIVVIPNTVTYEPGLTGSGRWFKIP